MEKREKIYILYYLDKKRSKMNKTLKNIWNAICYLYNLKNAHRILHWSTLFPPSSHSISLNHTHDVNVNVFVVCFKQLKLKWRRYS